VLTDVSKKMAVFWVTGPCRQFQRSMVRAVPDHGGSTDLWNFGKLVTTLQGAVTQKTAIFVMTLSSKDVTMCWSLVCELCCRLWYGQPTLYLMHEFSCYKFYHTHKEHVQMFFVGPLVFVGTTVTVTRLQASRSQKKRTTSQREQRNPGEWRQLGSSSVAKLAKP
jgi:hypothetical protein